MLFVTGLVMAVTLTLPFTPLADLLGFTPLPAVYLLGIGVIVITYFVSAELTKRWFFRRFGQKPTC
jgi:Mg2+-importing ATPase